MYCAVLMWSFVTVTLQECQQAERIVEDVTCCMNFVARLEVALVIARLLPSCFAAFEKGLWLVPEVTFVAWLDLAQALVVVVAQESALAVKNPALLLDSSMFTIL